MMGNEAFVNEPDSQRPLCVFLCHASCDKPTVRRLYQRLCAEGIDAWLDEEKLLPGHDWQREISRAVRASDVVIVCLSRNSVSKFGYVQKEIKFALDVADEQPEGTIYLIPLKLEECNVPDRLSRWHWVNYFDEKGWERLMRALMARSRDPGIGVALKEVPPISGREVEVEKAEAERKAREEAAQREAERQAKLIAEKAEADRLGREREAREKAAKEEAERQARLAAEKAEVERKAQEAAAREKAERKARKQTAKAAMREAHEKAIRQKLQAVCEHLCRVPIIVWAGLMLLLLLVGVFWVGILPGGKPTSSETPTVSTALVSSTHAPTEIPTAQPLDTPAPPTTTIQPTITPNPTVTTPPTNTPVPPSLTVRPTATPGIGSTRVSDQDGMVMVYVPAGKFLMGASSSDSWARDNEKPQHTVYLNAFWIDSTEVTLAQYKKCALSGPCTHGQGTEENRPVSSVDWNDATKYCQWVGRQLPTEAQWEKAARGTDGRIYPWGNQTATCDYAVMFDGNEFGCGKGGTWTVGSKPKGGSPYGALDMAGNVWEWVADWYDGSYYANSPPMNPQGPSSGQHRVIRGGDYTTNFPVVHITRRHDSPPENRNTLIGFRCVLPGD